MSLDIIKQAISDFRTNQSKARRQHVYKLLDYYTGSNTKNYIDTYFNSDIYNDVPVYSINTTKKFIDKMSRIYTHAPIRKFGTKENIKYNNYICEKDRYLKHVEKMTNLLGTIAVRVGWNELDEEFTYKCVYYFDAYFTDEDPYNPYAIIYPVYQSTDDARYQSISELKYYYCDPTVEIIYDENGNILSEKPNPYGRLPFIFFRDTEQIDDFFNEGASDIVGANEHINITMTNLQLGLHYQMVGQMWATGVYADQPITRVGPDYIINLPEGAAFGIAEPGGDPAKVIETVKFQLELLATSRHMFVTFDSSADRPSSGLALIIKDLEHIEDFKDDTERYKLFETKIFKLEKAIGEVHGISIPNNFSIHFQEIEAPRSTGEQIQKDTFMLNNGMITEAEILQRERGDLTLKEAQKIVDENKTKLEPPEPEQDGSEE